MSLVLAYVGPETMLPLASFAAAIGGAVLIGWRWIAAFFRRVFRLGGRGAEAGAPSDEASR